MDTFDEIKELVKYTIKQNEIFVNITTNWAVPGIYMIYLESDNNDKLLPIYIGQSKNIQDRFQKHLESLLGLNRIHPDIYKELFFGNSSSYYEGAFKNCKMHKYMVEKGATLEAFRMIILDICDPSELSEKESYYIDKFYAPYFGFNQLNSLTYLYNSGMRFDCQEFQVEKFMDLLEREMEMLPQILGYGFTHFNLNHAFPSRLSESYGQVLREPSRLLDLNSRLKVFGQTYKDIWKNHKYSELTKEHDVYNQILEDLKVQMDPIQQLITNEIELYSIKKGLTVQPYELKQNFFDLIKHTKMSTFSVLLQKKWSKQFQIKLEQFRLLQEKYDYFKEKERQKTLELALISSEYKREGYHEIVPNLEYPPFALQDRVKVVDAYKDVEVKENYLYLDMVFSSTGRRFEREQVPYLISVGMKCFDDQLKETEYRWYVKNECTEYTKQGLIYIEEDYIKPYAVSKSCFHPYAYTKENKPYLSSISVRTELKTGINDYTIRQNEIIPLEEILEKIESYISEETTVIVLTSEGPQTYERALQYETVNDNELFQLLSGKKPKSKRIIIQPAKKKVKKNLETSIVKKIPSDEEVKEQKK